VRNPTRLIELVLCAIFGGGGWQEPREARFGMRFYRILDKGNGNMNERYLLKGFRTSCGGEGKLFSPQCLVIRGRAEGRKRAHGTRLGKLL